MLNLSELRQVWQALDRTLEKDASSVKIATVTGVAIKLLILTGARRGEIAAMRWSELFRREDMVTPIQQNKKSSGTHHLSFRSCN